MSITYIFMNNLCIFANCITFGRNIINNLTNIYGD